MTPRLAALIATTVVAGAITGSAQSPLFTSRVDGVRVDVLVTERGRPIAGLRPADFDVLDNGVPQAIDLADLGDVPVNVVLTLDVSASVDGPKLEALKRAGGALIGALADADRAALVTFNRVVIRQVPLTRDIDDLRTALEGAESWGDTALVDASLGAMLLGDTDAGRTLVVIFSDGVDTASSSRPELVIETARRVNGVVYAVSSSEETPAFLRDLTAATGGRVLDIGEAGDPGPAFLEILQEFRLRYVMTFTPTGVTAGGWHRLDVRVKRPGTRAQHRAGYFSAK